MHRNRAGQSIALHPSITHSLTQSLTDSCMMYSYPLAQDPALEPPLLVHSLEVKQVPLRKLDVELDELLVLWQASLLKLTMENREKNLPSRPRGLLEPPRRPPASTTSPKRTSKKKSPKVVAVFIPPEEELLNY